MKTLHITNLVKLALIGAVLSLVVFVGGCGDDDNISIIIDDGDSGFARTGAEQIWNQGSGYGDDAYWKTTSLDLARATVHWTPDLSKSGTYKVQVYIPAEHSTTANARYTIVADGATYTRTINQSLFTDEWVELGEFRFTAAGTEYVELSDFTGENGREIAFDAMRWEK